jgi:hypothetical protein
VIAFNTMRYTFNMLTMLKEKVNTHFSFPFRLDMSPYMEHNLIPGDKKDVASGSGENGSQVSILVISAKMFPLILDSFPSKNNKYIFFPHTSADNNIVF